MGFEGLILGFLLGQIANLVVLAWPYLKWLRQQDFDKSGKVWGAARAYQDFPRYSLLSNWFHQASKQLPYFFLPFFFSQEVNGLIYTS